MSDHAGEPPRGRDGAGPGVSPAERGPSSLGSPDGQNRQDGSAGPTGASTRSHDHGGYRHPHEHHGHDGHHAHGELGLHVHAPAGRMRTAFWLTLMILAVEAAGGWLSGSLALWSDASHVLTDLGAIALSWYAVRMSGRPATARMTFGYHRIGILAALANAVTLIVIAAVIASEAVRRLAHPAPVHGWALFAAAAVGLALNLYMGLRLHEAEDLNLSSAALHMLSDAAASAAVLLGGVVMS
ncbi:MAG: cation diffusion facilitator family transporter, partial [Alicyclobacillus sp.]|nr:cation diffusion facilitator family transporter [Alicyclobacillus sp.]